MDNWIAFPKKDLMQELFLAELDMDNDTLQKWNKIKIPPQIWACKDVIEENFWVIAKHKPYIIWYNDIEEGFNISTYLKEGEILSYKASKNKLIEVIKNIV